MEAVGIPFDEGVAAVAGNDRRAAAANRPQVAAGAGGGTLPVAAGGRGIVNLCQGGSEDAAERGGEFAAGVDLPVGQQRQEVERGAAAIAGTAAKRLLSPFSLDQVEEVILAPENRVALQFRPVFPQERCELLAPGRGGAVSWGRQTGLTKRLSAGE